MNSIEQKKEVQKLLNESTSILAILDAMLAHAKQLEEEVRTTNEAKK